jgi:hypothetical protein
MLVKLGGRMKASLVDPNNPDPPPPALARTGEIALPALDESTSVMFFVGADESLFDDPATPELAVESLAVATCATGADAAVATSAASSGGVCGDVGDKRSLAPATTIGASDSCGFVELASMEVVEPVAATGGIWKF